ncbi:MAG TPA: HNH endonuclease domain-containing protein [Verrucomicrobiae bacterium]|nr:HNH endonuclease domain-containing protein [Verrucomicrobiae bacterium]
MKTDLLRSESQKCRDDIVWAFDLGKASIGEAVRQGTTFLHKASLLIPADFAETKTAATRRRMWRTRQAHKAREKWLEDVWQAAGMKVLRGRQTRRDALTKKWIEPVPGDKLLEQEFAESGDNTCYTSCLLRIKLLRGEKLEHWQVFKALRSAIQKRGYDRIPWAERDASRVGVSVEELEKKDPNYVAALNQWKNFQTKVPADFHFPCFYDAWKMGLWNPAEPQKLTLRLTHEAQSTRNIRFDRAVVQAEIVKLANQAATQIEAVGSTFERIQKEGWTHTDPMTGIKRHFPVTAKTFGDFLCHGPTGVAYASYFPHHRDQNKVRMGSADDWMGALGQKIPRFDNRILNDCVLIPRFHVCKADIRKDVKTGKLITDSLLSAQVTMLMKLKNTLVAADKGQRKLTVDEIRRIFEVTSVDTQQVKSDAEEWPQKVAACFKLTAADWSRAKGIKELGLRPLPGHEELKAPKHSGRSAFSRPALRLLKDLILSGKNPSQFYHEQIAGLNGNTDGKKGLIPVDLKFLADMGDSWNDLHIPTQKLDALAARHTENGKLDIENAVADLLADINDPVVRHRLNVFSDRLYYLRRKFGEPKEVVLEFVREDFMGPKRKNELLQFQRNREKARKEAREKAVEAGAEEKSAALKYELFKGQGSLCLYCGIPFAATKLDEYEIDHIVPRTKNGPDAMVNFVLAHRECNQAKEEQTPFQWWHSGTSSKKAPISWDGYKKLVDSHATNLRNKKVQLLLREDAPDLVQRYTALAETAWVSKLAQTIVSLLFGWKNGNDGESRKRVTVISGGLTGRIRRKYRLNSILNPCPDGEDSYLWEEKCDKNRQDDRHHALDAMVISFLPSWARDPKKEGFFRFPEGVHGNFFAQEIATVNPRNIAFEKPVFEETFYGVRTISGQRFIVGRENLAGLAIKSVSE